MMKRLPVFIFLFLAALTFGQTPNVINNQAIPFSIVQKTDTIDFILIDTILAKKKPVFLFCQGSLPVPLFIKTDGGEVFMIGGGVINFDLNEIKKHYHLVVISMPKTPLIVAQKNLNQSYCYVPNPSEPEKLDTEYVRNDYLENYEKRANSVLKFLSKQKWVDNSKLVVAGHSQGAKVATVVALNNKKVTHLGLFGANPFGRIDQNIRSYRKKAERGEVTWEDADRYIEAQYETLKAAYDAEKVAENPSLLAWKSFSRPLLNDWLKIEIPTYLAYGTGDITADLCDLVPLFYIQNAKTNLTHKRHLHLEHNFFEVDENGVVNYEKAQWKAVMNEFVKWSVE